MKPDQPTTATQYIKIKIAISKQTTEREKTQKPVLQLTELMQAKEELMVNAPLLSPLLAIPGSDASCRVMEPAVNTDIQSRASKTPP